MFAFTATTFAQDMACGDLAAEDCDLLYASSEAMAGVTSGSQFVGIEMQLMNVPQAPFTDLSFDFSVDTSYSYSEEASAAAMDLQGMDAAAMTALYSDPDALASTFATIVGGTSAEMSMTANFSEELVAMLGQPNMMFPDSITLNLVMVDGVGYLDLSTLEPLMAQGGMTGMSGWVGADIVPLVEQSIRQSAMQPGTMIVPVSGSGAGPLFTQLSAADPTGTLAQFLSIERGEDVDGAASFTTSIDWDAFVESPYFDQLIAAALQQNAASTGMMPSQTEIEQTTALARMFGPALLEGITLEVTETIDPETSYLTSSEFTFDWDLSQLAAMGDMTGMEISPDAVVYLNMVTENSGINEPVEITAPENAFVVPAEMLNQMMSGGMQ
jgi:hypothetical protein